MSARFRELHASGLLLLPNAWDAGSAMILESLGFDAIATTSSGHAATLGRLDGQVRREEALAHAAQLVAAVAVPVTADLENGFDDVTATVEGAVAAGLAGCSIEDASGDDAQAIFTLAEARERVGAAVAAADGRLVLTARCENHLHGVDDLADTIARLQAYQEAGADVLYAPGLRALEDIRRVVAEVDRPVNVLAWPGAPAADELAAAGVRRLSIGGAFAFAALGALVDAATELRDRGTYGFIDAAAAGSRALRRAVSGDA